MTTLLMGTAGRVYAVETNDKLGAVAVRVRRADDAGGVIARRAFHSALAASEWAAAIVDEYDAKAGF